MLRRIVELTALLFESGGTFAMAIGAIAKLGLALRDRAGGARTVFRSFRNGLGRAIVVGLELLVAADILRTIEIELEGRWPWEGGRREEPVPLQHPEPR